MVKLKAMCIDNQILNKRILGIIVFSFLLCGHIGYVFANTNADTTYIYTPIHKTVSLKGYIKEMPSVQFSKDFDSYQFSSVLHNRLNLRWHMHKKLSAAFEIRNRLIYNDMFKQYPAIADFLKTDNGFVDASFVPYAHAAWIWHTMADRFYLDWQHHKWQARIGRQRINWGINMVSNPNDLFNTYSFFDFDYEERPGADAMRLQYFTSDLSRLEWAIAPANRLDSSTVAMLFAFNKNRYDMQLLAGFYRNRWAIGGGWAGNIKKAGFKGEFTLFHDVQNTQPVPYNWVGATSIDYIFNNSMYVILELLYNGGHKRQEQNILMLTQPLSADNLSLSEWALTTSLMYPLSPILSSGLSVMYMPDMAAFFMSPNISYSVATNFDIALVVQYFYGKEQSLFANAGLSTYLQMKWSF